MTYPNRNTFYAEMFVDALTQSGLDTVCIAPGSRSTPLTLAFAKHKEMRKYTHLDERSAAFFALGLAMKSRRPVALVCTSGTAAANFYPAIIEADMSGVPLLILTADRPSELRYSGANQTIDQIKMYGDHVLWSVDMALPEANPDAVAVRNLRTTAARVFATANGDMTHRRQGVVHLNFPFRKPLEPVEVAGDVESAEVLVRQSPLPNRWPIEKGVLGPTQYQVDELVYLFEENPNGVIVCGRNALSPADAFDLAELTGYPILADPLSGVRYNGQRKSVISMYETFLQTEAVDALPEIDLMIRFGAIPTSKWLNQLIAVYTPKIHIYVNESGVWMDDSHTVDWQITVDPEKLVSAIMNTMDVNAIDDMFESELTVALHQLERVTHDTIEEQLPGEFFDAAAVAHVFEMLPEDSHVFVGNSNAIRHVDQFVPASDKRIHVYASRGASGIDGQISTALGIGAATGKHVYAILGDITFYHDMNGLLAIARNGVTVTIIVLNNNGGGIFERLPVRDFEPYHTDYFLTPHGLTFEHAASLYGLEYARVDDFNTLNHSLEQYIRSETSSIIEIQSNIHSDEARRKEIINIVENRIEQAQSES